ncbi:MAG: hypothetical protein J1E79_00710 [Rikenella sp.]|nr:hypothetical protein [Rikenella sp.]
MVNKTAHPKKRVIVSHANLSPELAEAFRATYPYGYGEALIRVDKPGGDFFYAVPFETEEISYLVKVDVKIDAKPEEDIEKDYYDDEEGEISGADQIDDTPDDEEDD